MPLPPVHAPFVCDAAPSQVSQLVSSALDYYAEGKLEDFYETYNGVLEQLSCVHELMSPRDVAQVHLLFAVENVNAQDDESARRAFEAAFEANPDLQIKGELLDLEVIRTLSEAARRAPPSPRKPMDSAATRHVYIDGVESTTRPTQRPAVMQVVWEGDPRVKWTGYLPESSFNLNYSELSPPAPCPVCGDKATVCPPCENGTCPELPKPPPGWMAPTAAGAGVAGLGLMGFGSYLLGRYWEGTRADDEEDTNVDHNFHSEAQGFQPMGWTLLGAGAGLGLLSVSLDIELASLSSRQRHAQRETR